MFKDYDKYLSTSLKVYLFVLIIIFILKLVGLDYFGLDVDNPILLNLNDFIIKYHLENIWYSITIYIYAYITIGITTNSNCKKLKIYTLCLMPIMIFVQTIKTNNMIFIVVDYVYLFLISIFYLLINKTKIGKVNVINYILFTIISILIQMISIVMRNNTIQIYLDNFIYNFIYNLDYLIMMIMFHNIYFKKGEKNLWEMVVSSSLQKLTYLKKYQKKSQRNSQNKDKAKVEIVANRIYFVLFALWNLFTLFCILFIGKLNNTLIECIFIIYSFWISKSVFGKPFHLPNMLHCFMVSNFTYYVLNRITTPLGISIIVPILLGVGLSYITSKLVKKTYKPLYRGMPEELFEETILKVEDKNSLKYKICYEFYIKKKSVVSLSIKYNYTESGIRKIKDRVNEKIKRLN